MWRKNGGFRGAHTCWFFPPLNPRQRQLCFRPLTKSQTKSLSWNGRDDFCLSSAVTACPGVWNRASQDLLLIDSSIHSKPLGGIFVLVLNYCPPASDKTRSKPNDVPWHLSASLSMTFSIFSVFFQDPKNLSQCLPIFSCFPSMCGRSLDF